MHRRGFTLLELLVASALGMVVMSLAMGGYRHSQKLITRAEALLRLHRVAGDIAERWERDCTALMQHVACNLTTDFSGSARSLVQFTGMRTVTATFDNRIYDYPHDTDLAWMRWQWKASDHRLTWSESPPPHWITAYPKEFFSHIEANSLPLKPVIAMRPNAVKTYAEFTSGQKRWYDPFAADPSAFRTTRIHDLLFLTGIDVDGTTRSYTSIADEIEPNVIPKVPNDLLASGTRLSTATWATVPVPDPTRTIAEDVSECSITIVTRDGTVLGAAGGPSNDSIDGADQDGLGTDRRRPDLLQLSLTLIDRRTGLTQAFTFVAKAPR